MSDSISADRILSFNEFVETCTSHPEEYNFQMHFAPLYHSQEAIWNHRKRPYFQEFEKAHGELEQRLRDLVAPPTAIAVKTQFPQEAMLELYEGYVTLRQFASNEELFSESFRNKSYRIIS